MKSSREFIIPFIGLKHGSHTFEYSINDAFFEGLEYSIIHSGEVAVDLFLEKKDTMLIAHFAMEGIVSTDCDRCTDAVNVPVSGEFQLIYKFGTEPTDDETLVIIHPDSYEIDVANDIYELITVSLPLRCIHEEGDCNEEMMATLSEYLMNPEEEDDDFDDDDFDEDDSDRDWDDDSDDDDDWGDDPEDDGGGGNIDPRWAALKSLTAESSNREN